MKKLYRLFLLVLFVSNLLFTTATFAVRQDGDKDDERTENNIKVTQDIIQGKFSQMGMPGVMLGWDSQISEAEYTELANELFKITKIDRVVFEKSLRSKYNYTSTEAAIKSLSYRGFIIRLLHLKRPNYKTDLLANSISFDTFLEYNSKKSISHYAIDHPLRFMQLMLQTNNSYQDSKFITSDIVSFVSQVFDLDKGIIQDKIEFNDLDAKYMGLIDPDRWESYRLPIIMLMDSTRKKPEVFLEILELMVLVSSLPRESLETYEHPFGDSLKVNVVNDKYISLFLEYADPAALNDPPVKRFKNEVLDEIRSYFPKMDRKILQRFDYEVSSAKAIFNRNSSTAGGSNVTVLNNTQIKQAPFCKDIF